MGFASSQDAQLGLLCPPSKDNIIRMEVLHSLVQANQLNALVSSAQCGSGSNKATVTRDVHTQYETSRAIEHATRVMVLCNTPSLLLGEKPPGASTRGRNVVHTGLIQLVGSLMMILEQETISAQDADKAQQLIRSFHTAATGVPATAAAQPAVVVPGAVQVLWNEMSWAVANAAAAFPVFSKVHSLMHVFT